MARVAIVVPVYRNTATLEPLAARVAASLSEDWLLRLVVDACPADSAVEATRLAALDSRISATILRHNVGQHRAIALGLAAEADSGADAWVCLDGDLQDPPEAIPELVAALEGPISGVFAGRCGSYESRGRRLTGAAHRRTLAAITGLPRDAGAFLAMDARLRTAVATGVLANGAPSIVAAAALSGLPLASMPVSRDVRVHGRSSWTAAARAQQSARTLLWAIRHRVPDASAR